MPFVLLLATTDEVNTVVSVVLVGVPWVYTFVLTSVPVTEDACITMFSREMAAVLKVL